MTLRVEKTLSFTVEVGDYYCRDWPEDLADTHFRAVLRRELKRIAKRLAEDYDGTCILRFDGSRYEFYPRGVES